MREVIGRRLGNLLSVKSLVTLMLTALLSPLSGLRLFGAAMASLAGQSVALVWNGGVLLRRLRALSEEEK